MNLLRGSSCNPSISERAPSNNGIVQITQTLRSKNNRELTFPTKILKSSLSPNFETNFRKY